MKGLKHYRPDFHPRYGVGMQEDEEGAFYKAVEADKRHADATARLVAEVKELRADRDDLADQLERIETEYTAYLGKQVQQ